VRKLPAILVIVSCEVEDMSMIPISEASTPMNLFTLNRSTPNMAPKRKIQILIVEVRIVKLATLVYSRQAVTK
jgi:hypothetical protein